jgi:hypothetical protein
MIEGDEGLLETNATGEGACFMTKALCDHEAY